MLTLRLRPAATTRFPAVAFCIDGQIAIVTVSAPQGVLVKTILFDECDDCGLLVKDASAAPKLYHDAEGTFRWITIHPGGGDEDGQPVKIRESKTEPGVWHVVAGAGGKLNYLKLTNVIKAPREKCAMEQPTGPPEAAGRAEASKKVARITLPPMPRNQRTRSSGIRGRIRSLLGRVLGHRAAQK
mgnify:FL=1